MSVIDAPHRTVGKVCDSLKVDRVRAMQSLQIGAGWFSEQPGGLERYYHELLVAMSQTGIISRGLVVGSDRVDAETDGAVRAFASSLDSLWNRWTGIRREFRSERAECRSDIVVAHLALYAFPILDQLRSDRFIMHFHGPWAAEGRREGHSCHRTFWKRNLERAVYRRADQLITLSAAYRDILCHEYGVRSDRVHVIPGGVNTARFAPTAKISKADARQLLGWPTDRPIVLCVRRLINRMGLSDLVDAFAEVSRRFPDALCLIAGKGVMQSLLQQHIDSHQLDGNVRLVGFVPDEQLPLAYRAADLTVMPSVALEGFGLAAVESLATGTPVIVTPVGGLPEVVNGLSPDLALPGTGPATIAEGIINALAHPCLFPNEAACRDYAHRVFNWEVVAPQVRSVYEKAV